MPSPDHQSCIFGGRSRWFWRPFVNIQPLITAHHVLIPLTVRSQVLQWGQSFKLTGQFIVQVSSSDRAGKSKSGGVLKMCGCTSSLASWSSHLPWVKFIHNSLDSSTTRYVSDSFEPPLFPSQETDVEVRSVQAHLCRARRVWREAWAALTRMAARNQRLAD